MLSTLSRLSLAILVSLSLMSTGVTVAQTSDNIEKVSVKDVPEVAKNAARDAAPGLYILAAERYFGDDEYIYQIQGRVSGEWYSVDVSEFGRVIDVFTASD